MPRVVSLAAVLAITALAQAPGPALSVDVGAARHPINPDVYGINFYWEKAESEPALAADLRATVRRWGGNNTSRYHWKLDVSNIDADWFFEVLPDDGVDASKLPEGSSFNRMVEQARTTGGKMMGTIPILGWMPRARQRMCSFSVAKYGPQCKVDPWWPDCGNGVAQDATCADKPVYIVNDPHDANVESDESLQREWVQALVAKYGRANQGGVAIWSLDNEPIWWSGTHRDIHPLPQAYDETIEAGIRYARAVKEADPTALIAGPISAGWESMYFSLVDCNAGWRARGIHGGPDWRYWNDPVDRRAHGGAAFVPWYLKQFADYEKRTGVRLLDILDLHAYIAPPGIEFTARGDGAKEALRLRSTRVFWDPNYVAEWLPNVEDLNSPDYGKPVAAALVPRMKRWVAENYPGLQTAITEYNWGAQESITGAIAQADILGIFGREGLDIGTLWGPPKPSDPGAHAFRLYRNYDGIGGAFGETAVQATTADADRLAIFAAQRSDGALTVVVLNKTTTDLASAIAIANFVPGGTAQVWRYSQAEIGRGSGIVRQADSTIAGNSITATFPAWSITLFVAPASLSGEKPVVRAVTSAASYGARIAPGQMVVVWGENLGPKDIYNHIQAQPNGVVPAEMQGVRILFDGVPAPMVYVSATQCSGVTPYFGTAKAVTHVVVEYRGLRSDPLEVAVSPSAPGLFTANAQGRGQAAGISPVAPGAVAVLWATGEGVTDPPGVDGRLAIDVLPKPVAKCSVEVGGLAAVVEYCGAAPWNMPGLLQVNARLDPNTPRGDAVPVKLRIGEAESQDSVTIAVH